MYFFLIVDTIAPVVIGCPDDIYITSEVGSLETRVEWVKPFATDHSDMIRTSATHEPGELFQIGSTDVIYTFEDESDNQNSCNFTVNVQLGKDSLYRLKQSGRINLRMIQGSPD